MKSSVFLRYSILITKLCIYLSFFVIAVCLTIASLWIVDSEIFNHWYLVDMTSAGIPEYHFVQDASIPGTTALNQINILYFIWITLRILALLVLIIISGKHLLKIMTSFKKQDYFYKTNIEELKKLAILGFIMAVLFAFNISQIGDQWKIHFTIPLGALFFSAICRVLAEVFEEGKRLMEDQKSIV